MQPSRKGWVGSALLLGAVVLPVQAETEPVVVEVVKPLPVSATETNMSTEQPMTVPGGDGAELLKTLTGVSGSRMGGKGVDPVIRGQKQNQLNVLLDGSYIYGGCPNRMDPPTSYTSAESYDRVTVIKGSHNVIYGPGGTGGVVLFERERPTFEAGKPYKGKVSAAYAGNGDKFNLSADVAAGSDKGYVRFLSDKTHAGNYRDGSGNEVRSSYKSNSNTLLAGAQIADQTWLEGRYEQVNEDNVLFPGAGMDSPYSDSTSWSLKLDHQIDGGSVERVRAKIYRSEVTHLMDNYSLRPAGMMRMAAPTSSDTQGGRVLIDSRVGSDLVQWGADYRENIRNGDRLKVMSGGMTSLVSALWPDVSIREAGLFAQTEHYLSLNDLIKAGARYDHVSANAARTSADDAATENNVGGFVTWSRRMNRRFTLESTLSRSVRTADATERYINSGSWQGNPDLAPEVHNQLDVMLNSESRYLSWSVDGYYDRVDDYILRRNNRYSNIAAALYGVDFDLGWQIDPTLRLSNGISWVKGDNLDTHTDLSQIPPLTARLALDYHKTDLRAGVEWLLAARQTDVCLAGTPCGGQDIRKTPGQGVVNVKLGYDISPAVSVDAGVNNLFDQTYAEHLNREDLLGNSVQVNEPGRTAWARLTARF